MKGVSTSNLDGEEHDLIVTYGDSDRSEPVEYSPAYRNNNFKTNLRIFGAASAAAGGRPQGANKLELRLCPAGLPGYTDTSCPCSTDVFEVGYPGGPPNAIPWDPATSYRFKISWTPGNIKYTRGVEPDVSIGYPGTLAPKALRVRIGSPRHGVGSVNRMPKGITFANLLIAGTPGTATPACTASDAGVDASATCDPTKPMRVDTLVMSGDIARVTYRHCAGASSFRIAQFFIGDVVDPVVPNLAGGYESGRLFAFGDSCAPGEAKKLVSAHGSLDCARTKVVAEGDKLTIDWAVSLDPLGLGIMPRPMFADAKGTGTPEPRLGWARVGTYDIATTSDAAVVVEETGVGTDAGGDAKRPAMQDEDLGGGELACGCVAGRRTPPNASLTLLLIALAAALRASRSRRLQRPRCDGGHRLLCPRGPRRHRPRAPCRVRRLTNRERRRMRSPCPSREYPSRSPSFPSRCPRTPHRPAPRATFGMGSAASRRRARHRRRRCPRCAPTARSRRASTVAIPDRFGVTRADAAAVCPSVPRACRPRARPAHPNARIRGEPRLVTAVFRGRSGRRRRTTASARPPVPTTGRPPERGAR